MEVKEEPMLMSPIRPIRTFSVAILNQRPTELENNNQSNSIEPMMEMKTTNKKLQSLIL